MEPGAPGHICEIIINMHTCLCPSSRHGTPETPGTSLGERSELCPDERHLGGSLDGAVCHEDQARKRSLEPSALPPREGGCGALSCHPSV